jgi:plasmid stabilization system protein ParE
VPLPAAWSPLRRRQFEHIKASLIASGRNPEKAAELAARTVNKARTQAGETGRRTGPRVARNDEPGFP